MSIHIPEVVVNSTGKNLWGRVIAETKLILYVACFGCRRIMDFGPNLLILKKNVYTFSGYIHVVVYIYMLALRWLISSTWLIC